MKFKTLFLTATLALILTGCGNAPETPTVPPETTPPTTEVPVVEITLEGTTYSAETTSLTLTFADGLADAIPCLPRLETVHFLQPECAPETLTQLRQDFPGITFTWEKEVFGTTYPDSVTEIDLSGIPMEDVTEAEALMGYFPNLEKLIMCDCGIDNETMAAFRDRAREQYKVVWSIQIRTLTVRTDETTFMPVKHDVFLFDNYTHDLVYLEDLIVLDLGHMPIYNIDFVRGMPHLQYLIVADTMIRDIEAIADHKELVYLEIFKLNIDDYTPLLSCTALEDLNIAQTAGDPAVLAQMPWLKNLWMVQCGVSDENRQLLTESLTNTRIEFDLGWTQGDNWRTLENYYKMRDLLEMPYNVWW